MGGGALGLGAQGLHGPPGIVGTVDGRAGHEHVGARFRAALDGLLADPAVNLEPHGGIPPAEDNGFFPFCSIGMAPQDITYAGEPTRLEIGDHNEIREFVTINRGTVKGGGVTRVGSYTLVMAYTHIAHDCIIGDHVILANAATLGGHITVGEWAVVGALCPVHHFVRIGAHSFIGGGTTITRDVLPFSKTAAARDTHAYGLNAVGLERRGFSKERIRKIHHAYKLLLASKLNTSQALERLKSEPERGADVDMLIRFIEASERGVIK